MKLTAERIRSSLLGLALLLSLTAAPAAPVSDIESHVFEYDMANGLHIIVYVDSSAPVATTSVWYKVGSYDEPLGSTGLSHMLEHMTFKHTDFYKPGQLDLIIDSAGGNNNGFTSTYYTAYYEDFAKDRYELAMKIEAARMAKCVFPDSEFESEHQVVSEERRLHDNYPAGELWELFGATAQLVNPERNPTIGWSDDVRHFTVQAVRDWYKQHYNPANAVLVVCGDVRPDDVRAKAERHFGKFKGTPVERRDFYGVEPKQNGERRITIRKRVRVPNLIIGYQVPGVRDSAWYAGEVAGTILGGGETSRLYKKLVNELGLATSVWSGSGVSRDPSLFQVGVTPKAESLVPKIERAVQAELDRAGSELASERELQQVRNQVLAGQAYRRDNMFGMTYWLASSYILFGTWRQVLDYADHINRVTPEQVREYCAAYLKPDNRTTGILVSTKESK
jgi:zinc protease